ncbi:hypothetical protein [Komagataeibacter diospyri]|uniref:Uncharacterized protein n=1 Tax=Komagataeibacter diospyri TaxID=1932662 RepID=A0A4V0WNG3_9PROT|nr:hypothetical protein [Komagataeibacter diospyri]GCE83367.1 hypothetical protein MSKU9_1508 [Komagataeibacter diospyri]GCE90116.1 hypothetical protein MSKU15_1717 [Komagataeibacter diospyri]
MKNTGRIAAGLLVLAGLATAAPQAHAYGRHGGGDAFVGGLVGGLVGGAVAGAMVDAYGPPPPPPPPMYYRPAPPVAYYAPPPPPPPVVVYGPYGGPGRPYY